MTTEELQTVLENNIFILQPPFDPIKYEFKNNIVYKDNKSFCKYQILKGDNNNFIMTYSNHLELTSPTEMTYKLIFGFDNILITIENDSRFPVIINSEPSKLNGTFTVLRGQ